MFQVAEAGASWLKSSAKRMPKRPSVLLALSAREAVLRTPNYYQPLVHCAGACAGSGDDSRACEFIGKAEAIETGILSKYVDEMRKWSANSRHKDANHAILAKLLECCSAASAA